MKGKKSKNKIRKKVRHLAVVAIIFDKDNRVLLTQRYEPKSTHSHGKWQFPGGGIEFGEHPLDALQRELKEEIGISVKVLTTEPFVHSQMFEKENIHALLLGFPARYISGTIDTSGDPNTGDAKWYSLDEIDYSVCLPQVKEMIENAQKFIIHNL